MPKDPHTYDAETEGWGTALHVLFWIALVAGLWFEWTPALTVGFLVTVGNVTSFYLPIALNAVLFLITLPFEPKTTVDANLRLALLMGLIVQVWQFFVWIQGAATN